MLILRRRGRREEMKEKKKKESLAGSNFSLKFLTKAKLNPLGFSVLKP